MALFSDSTRTAVRSRSLWRNRDYLLLWGGQGISLIGTQVSQLAFPLLILALTHAPLQAGIAGALRALPYLVLGHLTILHVYLVALIEGTLFVFFNLAEVSCLPRVVAPAQLPTAVARNETTTNLGYLL